MISPFENELYFRFCVKIVLQCYILDDADSPTIPPSYHRKKPEYEVERILDLRVKNVSVYVLVANGDGSSRIDTDNIM